jgi:hypothetical protein
LGKCKNAVKIVTIRECLEKTICHIYIVKSDIYFNALLFTSRVYQTSYLKAPFRKTNGKKSQSQKRLLRGGGKKKLYTNPFTYPIFTSFCNRIAFIQTRLFS